LASGEKKNPRGFWRSSIARIALTNELEGSAEQEISETLGTGTDPIYTQQRSDAFPMNALAQGMSVAKSRL
jgi:hypothetical protein